VQAGSGLVTFGTSSSAGVPEAFANETLVLPLNDAAALTACFEAQHHDLAAVIIEPIPANNGLLLQDLTFLNLLRSLCTKYGVLLIFDEVISGFRVAFGGAAELYGITPDMVTYGKIIGGGLPVGAYGARKEIMAYVSPEGPVYQAGTLSGNPVAMAAGLAQLELCAAEGFYTHQAQRTQTFVDNINAFALAQAYPMELVCVGSIFWFSFNGKKRITAASQIASDMAAFNFMHHYLLDVGVYFGPSGYEVGFVSSAHTDAQLDYAAEQIKAALAAFYQK
jgi:glutamate-1-semialdehyde 2,1-aminomutase